MVLLGQSSLTPAESRKDDGERPVSTLIYWQVNIFQPLLNMPPRPLAEPMKDKRLAVKPLRGSNHKSRVYGSQTALCLAQDYPPSHASSDVKTIG